MCQRLGSLVLVLSSLALCLPLRAQNDADARDRQLRRTPVVDAIEKVAPAVVSIRTQAIVRRRHQLDPFFQFFEQDDRDQRGTALQDFSLGSGVIIDKKGYVITNDHVIRQADRVHVALTDGRVVDARVVGSDPQNDIAVLKIDLPEAFPTAKLGRDDDLMIGEVTLAMGNPFGLDGSVTEGILSQKNRTVRFQGKQVFKDFLQTSAVINPGNSGGPLINVLGEVIGINVAIHSGGPGIGFAIPISRVRDVIYNVLDPRVSRRVWLGLQLDHRNEAPGALVAEVDDSSPAARSGIEPGDVIVDVGGQPIDSWIGFRTAIESLDVGKPVALKFLRGGSPMTRRLALEAAPATPEEQSLFRLLGFEFGETTEEFRRLHPRVQGVRVTKIYDGSAADEVGVDEGDVIVEMGNINALDRDKTLRIAAAWRQSRRGALSIHLYRESDDSYYGGEIPAKFR